MLEKTGEMTRKKALLIVAVAAAAILLTVWAVHASREKQRNAATAQERVAFLDELGWTVDPESESAQTVLIPDCGEGAMADYNALMLSAGYDLNPFSGKSVEQYCYEILNYPGYTGSVTAVLYVHDGRVIGGDIHTAALNGFMHELRKNPQS
ncbi:MAG: DUF4830 domain-containing protein [Oscillospiraceae bacterium]|nr:DUF4830 domain-containing protein [Oscillospiraceae bacterium]